MAATVLLQSLAYKRRFSAILLQSCSSPAPVVFVTGATLKSLHFLMRVFSYHALDCPVPDTNHGHGFACSRVRFGLLHKRP